MICLIGHKISKIRAIYYAKKKKKKNHATMFHFCCVMRTNTNTQKSDCYNIDKNLFEERYNILDTKQ